MSFTKRINKRRAAFWAALCHDGNNGIEELLKLYWWWGSDAAEFFGDKFVLAGLSLENLEAEKKNAVGTMQTAVRDDVSQLPRLFKAQRDDINRLAVSVANAAFDARLDEWRRKTGAASRTMRQQLRLAKNARPSQIGAGTGAYLGDAG